MRQQSQKFSLKDDQKLSRLPSNNTTSAKQPHPVSEQALLQPAQQTSSQRQHDPQTQMIYDLMNFQNKPISNASRQLNLKIPIGNKHHHINPKLPSQTHQGNLFNLQAASQNQEELSPPVNVHQASQTSNTGQFFRQAALNTLQKDQNKMNNDADQQMQQQQNTFLSTGFDLSEKSTTAATAFPHLSTKGSTFHRKQPSIPFNEVPGQQPPSSNPPVNLNMPTIPSNQMNLQGQKIRGFTKMGRRYNAVNYQQQQDSIVNDSTSLQRNNFHGDILGAHTQPVNNKNNQRQSIEKSKIQPSQSSNQHQQQSGHQIVHQNHLTNVQPSLQIIQQHSEEIATQQNISPSSNLQLQRRLQSNGAETLHLNFNKIGNQIQQSFQQALTNQISNNQHVNSNDSQDNAMTIRDIKIRKVHPQQKIQKNNLRFQTAQLILDTSTGNNQNTTRQNPLHKKQDTSAILSHLPLLPLQPLVGSSTFDLRQHDQDDSNHISSDNEAARDMMSRRRSDSEKEIIIYKTLNLEERRRLIKQHHKMRRYNDQDQSSSANDSGILDKSSSAIRTTSQDPNELHQDANDYLNLDTIEEETNNNEEVKSQVSKLLSGKEVSKSIQTLSSGMRVNENQNSSRQFLPLAISNQGNNSTQNSPIISKFKRALQSSESFNLIYKKIKGGGVTKGEEEYKQLLDNMCKISGLTVEETEHCIDQIHRSEFKEKFHNPYYKQSVSSHDSIEENIASISLNHSFSLVNVGFNIGSGYSRQPSNSGSSNWTQQYGQQQQPYTMAGGSNQQLNNKVSVGDSIGNFSGQSKLIANDSRSNGQNSEHRSQISKKSSGQQVKSDQGSSNSTSGPKKGQSVRNSNKNQSSSSQKSNDHKGLNIIGSNGGGSSDSQKVTNENQVGKSPLPEKNSKSQARHEFYAEPRKPGLTLEMLKQSRGQSIQPQFNDILSGVKAPLAEKNINQVYGNLIKWREGKKIGQGTSGEVYLAQNLKTFHIFVVKKLNLFTANSGIDKDSVQKLKKEIEVYRKLDHENVVKYIGSEIVNNQFCIYLEYLSGGSICGIYQSFGKLPEQTIKVYTRQILKGLVYLHQNKVVHCDLKGANVLVDQTGVVKLTDFGCAKLFESSFSQSDFSGVIRGSLAWMAPEVLLNKGIRRKADIWSLGCLVIEMAVAGNPWGNDIVDNYFQAMLKVADPNKLPTIPSELSESCKDFISKCLTRDYDKRPSSLDLWAHPWLQNSL